MTKDASRIEFFETWSGFFSWLDRYEDEHRTMRDAEGIPMRIVFIG